MHTKNPSEFCLFIAQIPHLPFFISNPQNTIYWPLCTVSHTVHVAKNVCEFIKCEECSKVRLLYSRKKLNNTALQVLKNVVSQFAYIYRTSLLKYQGMGGEPKIRIFPQYWGRYLKRDVRENISSTSRIEVPYYFVPFYKKYAFGAVLVDPKGCLETKMLYLSWQGRCDFEN